MDAWRNKALFRVMVTVAVSVSTVGALLLVAGLCASTCNKNNDPLVEDPEVIELGPYPSTQVRSANISISTHHDDGLYFVKEVGGESQMEACEADAETMEDMSVPVNLAGGDGSD